MEDITADCVRNIRPSVIPAEAGIQILRLSLLDSGSSPE